MIFFRYLMFVLLNVPWKCVIFFRLIGNKSRKTFFLMSQKLLSVIGFCCRNTFLWQIFDCDKICIFLAFYGWILKKSFCEKCEFRLYQIIEIHTCLAADWNLARLGQLLLSFFKLCQYQEGVGKILLHKTVCIPDLWGWAKGYFQSGGLVLGKQAWIITTVFLDNCFSAWTRRPHGKISSAAWCQRVSRCKHTTCNLT